MVVTAGVVALRMITVLHSGCAPSRSPPLYHTPGCLSLLKRLTAPLGYTLLPLLLISWMIIDKSGVPRDDEPPSYSSVNDISPLQQQPTPTSPSNRSDSYFPNDRKTRPPPSPAPSSSASTSARSRIRDSVASSSSASSKAPAGWLGHLIGTQQAKQDLEVRLTVLGLVSQDRL